jgi:DNA-binding FadR family transcriptional regulator
MALRNRDERNLTEVAGNHPPIVQALADGDANRAIKLISDHTRILAAFDPATIVQTK